jgi:hypothetical protein
LADSQALAVKTLYQLQPQKNKEEFEHYRLMADIRMLYLSYQKIEAEVNDPALVIQNSFDCAAIEKTFN